MIKSEKTGQSFDLTCCDNQNIKFAWRPFGEGEGVIIHCASCGVISEEATFRSHYEWTELCCAERFQRTAMYYKQNNIEPKIERLEPDQLKTVHEETGFIVKAI